MSSFRSRLTSFFNASKSSSWTDLEGSVAGNSDGNDQSALKIRSKKEELGFLELVPGIDPVVDIIAIHGLDGHREKTWMAENGTLWLRDLLPADLPNVRVLAYGYDADTRSRECVSTQTIYQQADKFVKSLTRERSNAPRRPIIFVAHSLGGIVLKQAIILCHNQTLNSTNKLRDILVSTHAVLFFGTPHSGVKGADLLEVLNRLLSVYMKTTNVILQHLKENSPELENIQGLYISASEKIHTVFFYEVYPTPIMGGRRQMIVPRHSAILAGDRQATEEGLYADHCEMVKFPDKYHGDYKTVLSYLKQYIQGAIAAVTDQWSAEDAHRVVARGYNPQNAIQPKARPSVSRSYVEREQIQSLITQKLLPHGDLQNQPRCVLYGLGGAGKTQLAAKWIREHESSFTRIICVDASSQTQLEADLEQSIRSLGPEYSAMTWEDAVAYLDDKEKGWLLFVDNADSPILELSLYLPTSIHGTILIASRNSECASYAPDSAVSVGSLEKSEAVKLLHSVANIAPTSDTESLQIAEELGMFALAITQAGAYIRKTRRLDKYLDTFRVHRKQLLSKGPDIGKEYTSSTYAAFNLSFNDLPKNAQEVLKLCAFLYHSSIPVSLFEISAKSGFSTYTVRKGCPPPESDITLISSIQGVLDVNWDPVVFQQLVELAARASFIEASTDGLFYNVHPLLQMYIRDCINEEGDERYARMAAQLLLGAIRPSEGGNAQLWQLLPHVNNIPRSIQSESVAHALAFFELYDSLGDWKACQELLEPTLAQVQQNRGENDEDVIWLKAQLASALQSLGEVERAERIQREVLDLQIKTIGPHHTDTISAMSDLAVTLSDSGKLDEAEEIQREVLARRLDTLGKRHPDTIWAMSNLASTLSDRELLDEAETIEREVLALQLDVLGPRHPDTLSAMSNLGKTLSSIGRLDEAEKIQRDVLSLRLEILGPRHPHTVSAMNNLANTLSDSGQFDEAVKLQREVLTLRLSLLGPRHLDTVWAMSNLGSILSECGRLDEAEKLERNVLALRLDILGSHHPDTITAMNNLASTLSDQGHLVETEKMKREILALQVETLGPRHADTISAMGSLASTLSDRGQLKQAEKMKREVLTLRCDVLGPKHPDTIAAMNNLANTLSDCGQWEEGEKIRKEVLALQLDILGPRHADTISAMSSLASTLSKSDQLDEAEKIERQVLNLRTDILGSRHPETVSAMNNLAVTLSNQDKLDEAEKIQREILNLRLDTLGLQHPDTVWAMSNLASTLSDLGRSDEAEAMKREMLSLQLEVLGPRHPDTISAMNNLANTLNHRGQLAEAEKVQRGVLALRLAILGPQHPDVVSAMNNLAITLSDLGQLEEAEKMKREVLALQLEILGPHHVDTIAAMSSLASTLSKCGKLDEAEKIQQQVVTLRIEFLGPQYPDPISAKKNLANTLFNQGQLAEAERIQREVLTLQLDILGSQHPDTASAMTDLAKTLSELGQLDEAEKIQHELVALNLNAAESSHPDIVCGTSNLTITSHKHSPTEEATGFEPQSSAETSTQTVAEIDPTSVMEFTARRPTRRFKGWTDKRTQMRVLQSVQLKEKCDKATSNKRKRDEADDPEISVPVSKKSAYNTRGLRR